MDRFRAAFEGIEDPRSGNRLQHDLLEVLFMALCASLCGAESCVDHISSIKRGHDQALAFASARFALASLRRMMPRLMLEM